MCSAYVLTSLADQELLDRLNTIVGKNNQWTAVLLAHIAEADTRKLHLGSACSSMHTYCVDILNFSEGAAYKRIHAARAARTYPIIFELVASGALHLSGVTLLAAHLTQDNHRELLGAASRKSKRAIEQLIAARAPKPDVPATIRKLPSPPPPSLFSVTPLVTAHVPAPKEPDPAPMLAASPCDTQQAPPPKPAPNAVTVLAEDRYKVQFTASRRLKDKISTARALLRHAIPDGDLEDVMERAVDALLEKLSRRKFAATSKPTTNSEPEASDGKGSPVAERPIGKTDPKTTPSRHIPAAVRRRVVERDGLQCSFVDPKSGRRCAEQGFLEFHHQDPFAKGGAHSFETIRLFCRAHNGYQADLDYGAHFMRRKKEQAPGQAGLWDRCPNVQGTAEPDSPQAHPQPTSTDAATCTPA